MAPSKIIPPLANKPARPTRRRRRHEFAASSMRQDPRLIDTHGRVLRDLRVSLTDRCNFRLQSLTPSARRRTTLPARRVAPTKRAPGLWSD